MHEGLIEFVDTPQADDDIQVYSHAKFGQIRIAGTPKAPEFCAMDLCKALGYANGRKAVADHCDEDDVTKRYTIDSMGRNQLLTYVNESGMYALILGSKLPQAKQFKHWVTSEVLPSIRKTGSYSVKLPQTYAEALRELAGRVEENERLMLENKQQAQTIEQQKPKVVFAESITGCSTNILIRDLAKLIQQNGYNIGEKRLYQWMRDNGYLCTTGQNYNKPMQRYIEQGIFFIKEGSHSETV